MTTNNDLTLFDFNSHSIRVVAIEGEPWFVAVDVCRALGLATYAGAAVHLKPLSDTERRSVSAPTLNPILGPSGAKAVMGGAGKQSLISESGLYKLVMRSDKPEAKAFQDWVTRVVLPAIRKDGSYVLGEEKVVSGEMTEDELMARALIAANNKLERLTREKMTLEQENAKQRHQIEMVTVDTYRTLHHRNYWTHSFKVKVAKKAQRLAKAEGIELGTEARKVTTPYGTFNKDVAIYPKNILDRAFDAVV